MCPYVLASLMQMCDNACFFLFVFSPTHITLFLVLFLVLFVVLVLVLFLLLRHPQWGTANAEITVTVPLVGVGHQGYQRFSVSHCGVGQNIS